MAVDLKKKRDDERKKGFKHEAEAKVREAAGIETLTDDEELIDDATFAKLHDALASARDSAAQGGGAAAPDPADSIDELLLEEVVELPPDREHAPPRGADGGPSQRAPAPPADETQEFVPAVDPVPESPTQVAALEAEIQGAADRDDVARLGMRLARRFARCAALLVVNRGVIAGLRGEGEGVDERIEGVMISCSVDGLFARAAEIGKSVRASAPFDGMDARVLTALGRRDVHGALVVPIAIRGRVVNLLYADNGPDPIPLTSAAALEALGICIAQAYERLILSRKRPGP